MKTYHGIAYRQSKDDRAPWLISFVASAEEILTWASIPRRSDNVELGFQRIANEDKVAKAKEFFELASLNQSPTAIVLGIHPSAVGQRTIELDFDETSPGTNIRECKLKVDIASLPGSIDSQVATIRKQIEVRLGEAEAATDEAEEVADTVPEAHDQSANDEDSDDQDVELGRSQLRNLLARLDDPIWCEANKEHLEQLSKPATIIDGQHRILGAAGCERNIPFTFCAIFNCDWEEQVYQFTVVNYTSDKIPDQFITANAALSLTATELDGLQKRLVQAGVKVVEYNLMKVVNFERTSPFYDKVNLTEKADPTLIGYRTMIQVARRWYSGRHDAVKLVIRHLYPEVRQAGKRIETWKDGDWGVFFLAFWRTVEKTYQDKVDRSGRSLWAVGTHLMTAVVLLELQEVYLKNLNAQDEEYFQPREGIDSMTHLTLQIERRAEKVMEYIPPEFFAAAWKLSSLNTGPGRVALKAALDDLVDSKGKADFRQAALITGNIT